MSHRFFSSDYHLNHGNIMIYCGRPWVKPEDYTQPDNSRKPIWVSSEIRILRATTMNNSIIKRHNERVKPEDFVCFLGDFCFRGRSHGENDPYRKFLDQMNGTFTFIEGNHDYNNGVKGLEYATIKFGGKNFFLCHQPPYRLEEIPDDCDCVLCGHVHEAWKWRTIEKLIPCINVGVDVWNFYPVKEIEILSFLAQITKTIREEGKFRDGV